MPYYDTIEEDLKRAKEILEKGKPSPDDFENFNALPEAIQLHALQGGRIYQGDNYAAYKLLESFVQEIEKFHGLFSDYEDPCRSFEQAEMIWNEMKRREGVNLDALVAYRRQIENIIKANDELQDVAGNADSWPEDVEKAITLVDFAIHGP